jgi:hypothetical protein
MVRSLTIWILLVLTGIGCRQKGQDVVAAVPDLQNTCVQHLTDVIVHDIFNPPVASRIYAYSNLAFYEALRAGYPAQPSFTASMNGFDNPGAWPKDIDARAAAVTAFFKVAQKLVFSKDSVSKYRQQVMLLFRGMDDEQLKRSEKWGETVGEMILKRAASDQYAITRSMPRLSVFQEAGVWKQTPPDYSDAVEPHWRLIKPLMMDSAAACKPQPPNPYTLTPGSAFHKDLMEVYHLSLNITPQMDTIARFWDDNPFVSEHKGHLTFATKKMTPVGHWMAITGIVSRKAKADEIKTATAYALAAAAIFDGFISCWEEKYRSKTVRPITVIREHLASEWNSLLQTPPFPEYTSGHSVISAAAATVLTHVYGENFAFRDDSELPYLGLERSFPSINAAAEEAGLSRLYGGIHFRAAIENGEKQGERVGKMFTALIP